MTDYVLIPGAWHGGWAWNPVAQRLRAAHHRVVTVTLPGLGDGDDRRGLRLDDAIDWAAGEVLWRDLDNPVLVSHGFGGVVAAGAAGRLGTRLSGLVFVDAYVPVPGETMFDAVTPAQRADGVSRLAASADGSVAPPDPALIQRTLFQNGSEDAARVLSALMSPYPGGYCSDPYDGPEVASIPVPMAYILAEQGTVFTLSGEQLAARLGVEPIRIPGTHEALLTHPDEVAGAILAATGARSDELDPVRLDPVR